jgi:hypothetical protein
MGFATAQPILRATKRHPRHYADIMRHHELKCSYLSAALKDDTQKRRLGLG